MFIITTFTKAFVVNIGVFSPLVVRVWYCGLWLKTFPKTLFGTGCFKVRKTKNHHVLLAKRYQCRCFLRDLFCVRFGYRR